MGILRVYIDYFTMYKSARGIAMVLACYVITSMDDILFNGCAFARTLKGMCCRKPSTRSVSPAKDIVSHLTALASLQDR